MAETYFNYFGPCVQIGLERSKCPLLDFFIIKICSVYFMKILPFQHLFCDLFFNLLEFTMSKIILNLQLYSPNFLKVERIV